MEDYMTDEDDDFDYQDPRPYLFEPEFTEEELHALDRGREDVATSQGESDERTATTSSLTATTCR